MAIKTSQQIQPDQASRRLPAAVIALGVTSLFADIGSEMIFPLLPLFVASLGASTTFLGLVEGLADATSSLLKLASGAFADRAPRKKPIVLFGYSIAALARPLVSLATAPWQVLAVRVTDRVGKGLRSSPRDVLIAASVPKEETGRAFGFQRAMDHAGAVLGPLVATALLASGIPVRRVFGLAIIPGLLSVLAVTTVREPKAAALPAPQPATGPRRLPRSLRSYLAICFLFSLGNSSDVFLLLRARDLGVPTAVIPLLWSALHVAKLVSSYLGGSWSDRIARRKLIAAGWLVYAATYLGFAFATRSWHAWALFLIYGAYYGLTEPAEKALVKDLSPAELRGRAYGLYNFIVGISAIPAGLFMGFLWQAFSPLTALSAGAAIAAVSAAALSISAD